MTLPPDLNTDWIHTDILPNQNTKTYNTLFSNLDHELRRAPETVPAILDKINDTTAIRIQNERISDDYLVRANNGLLERWSDERQSDATDIDGWFRVIYQSHSLYVKWLRKAVDENHSNKSYELIDASNIGSRDTVNTIVGAYADLPVACPCSPDVQYESQHLHAEHVWDNHQANALQQYRVQPNSAGGTPTQLADF